MTIKKLTHNECVRDAAFLVFLVAIFCLKFYNRNFLFQGDVPLNLYMHGNPSLFYGGWDPYGWFYLGWYPIFGIMFPLNVLMHWVIQTVNGEPLVVLKMLQANAALSLFLLAYFSFLLLRYLDIGRNGSLLGAVIMISTGFHIQTSMLELDLFYLHSFMFVPLVLLFLAKAFKEESPPWVLAAGVSMGISILSGGNVPMFMYVPLFPLIFLMVRPFRDVLSWRMWLRAMLYTAATCIIGVIIGSAMVLPSIMNMQFSARDFYVSSQIIDESVSLPLESLLKIMFLRDWWISNTEFALHEVDSFIGLPVIVMMFVGLLCKSVRKRGAAFMGILILYAIFLMFIASMPSYLTALPAFYLKKASIRFPFRFFMVLLLAVAYFAATGLEALLTKKLCRLEKVALCILAPILLIAYGYQAFQCYETTMIYQTQPGFLVAHALFAAMILTIFAARCPAITHRIDRKWLSYATPTFVFLFYLFARPQMPATIDYSERDLRHDANWNNFYHETTDESLDRYYWKPSASWEALRQYDLTPFRIVQTQPLRRGNLWAPRDKTDIAFDPGLDPAAPFYLFKFLQEMMEQSSHSPLFDLYNIKYAFSDKQGNSAVLKPTKFPGIYINPHAFERFFVVHGTSYFADDDELLQAMAGVTSSVLKEYAFLVSPEKTGYSAKATLPFGDDIIHIQKREPTHIQLEVKTTTPGFLIATEPWVPLWKAYVDDNEVELLRADSAFWGVELTPGQHQVEFKFADRYALIGRIISGCCLSVVTGALIYLGVKKRKQGQIAQT